MSEGVLAETFSAVPWRSTRFLIYFEHYSDFTPIYCVLLCANATNVAQKRFKDCRHVQRPRTYHGITN